MIYIYFGIAGSYSDNKLVGSWSEKAIGLSNLKMAPRSMKHCGVLSFECKQPTLETYWSWRLPTPNYFQNWGVSTPIKHTGESIKKFGLKKDFQTWLASHWVVVSICTFSSVLSNCPFKFCSKAVRKFSSNYEKLHKHLREKPKQSQDPLG